MILYMQRQWNLSIRVVMIGCRWWLSFADKEREPLPLNSGCWHPCRVNQARCRLSWPPKPRKAKQRRAHSASALPHISTGITPRSPAKVPECPTIYHRAIGKRNGRGLGDGGTRQTSHDPATQRQGGWTLPSIHTSQDRHSVSRKRASDSVPRRRPCACQQAA